MNLEKCMGWFSRLANKSAFLPSVLTRISLALVFAGSGWGKLHNLDQTIEFFQSLGIPFANLQAPFVAGVELVGGVLIFLGLATRFATLPLVVIMGVAIRTAQWEELSGISSLVEVSEFLYIILLLWLLAKGGGRLSLDYWVKRRLQRRFFGPNQLQARSEVA